MAFLGTGPVVDRLQALFRQYLNTHVNVIDTAANAAAHAGVCDADFATPCLADEDIQTFFDCRDGEPVRLVVVPPGIRTDRELQRLGVAISNVRLDQDHLIEIHAIARSCGGADGVTGGWRQADRIAHAVSSVLMRYPQLDIPDATTPLARYPGGLFLDVQSVDRLSEQDNEDTERVTLVTTVRIRTMETAGA